MKVCGTYDVLVLPFLLDRAQVLSFLPERWQSKEWDPLLPVPQDVLSALGLEAQSDGKHLALLQLGYQNQTGIGPRVAGRCIMGMWFNEAKLEIPYVRHPHLQSHSEKADDPFLLKQTILFSSILLSGPSQYLGGLRSFTASFSPASTPNGYAPDAPSIEYNVKDWVEASLQRDFSIAADDGGAGQAAWEATKTLLDAPWTGANMGPMAMQFEFETAKATIQPTAYDFKATLHNDQFTLTAEVSSGTPPTTQVSGKAWRFKAPYTTSNVAKADSDVFTR